MNLGGVYGAVAKTVAVALVAVTLSCGLFDQTDSQLRKRVVVRPQVLAWEEAKGHLTIVIDDVGREMDLHTQLQDLPLALTFSVLPGAAHTKEAQRQLTSDPNRREVWLHLPMEPMNKEVMLDKDNAVEEFVLLSDSAQVVRAKVERALAKVPQAVGVNNHTGSALTASADAMGKVMPVIAKHKLLFLDSRTTAETRAEDIARQIGVFSLHRHVFLDHVPEQGAIEIALENAIARSVQEPTVVIAHPSPEVVRVLADGVAKLRSRGIGVYSLSSFAKQIAKNRPSAVPAIEGVSEVTRAQP